MSKCRKYTLIGLVLLLALVTFAALAACAKQPPTVLSTPENLRIEDEILYWDEVAGAEKYLVTFNDEEYETNETQFDFFLLADRPKTYRMSVMALGNTTTAFDSFSSEEVEFTVPNCPLLATETDDGYKIKMSPDHIPRGKLVIPETVNGVQITGIERQGFENCTKLTSVILPDSISSLGVDVFKGCTNLTRIKLPRILNEIPMNAFANCSSLWDVEIPPHVESINKSAFAFTASLKEIKLPAAVTKLEDSCFAGNGLERIEIDEGNPIFRSEGNCIIQRVDETLLFGCPASKIPYGVKTIGKGAFRSSALTEIEIPNSVTKIENTAFAYSKLNSIKLSSSLTTIEHTAFASTELTDIELPSSVTKIGSHAFTGTKITRAVLPESVTELEDAFVGCHITELSVKEGNPVYYSKGNCVLSREGNVIVMGCIASEIPAEAEAIGKNAFQSLDFTEFVIPANIKEIGEYAFYACTKLHSITLSDGLKKIRRHAFDSCASLEGVAIPESVTEVEISVFADCPATLYLPWEENSIPSGWIRYKDPYPPHDIYDWNGYPFRAIFYGCTLGYDEERRCYVISTAELTLDTVTYLGSVRIPCRAGYTFAGWATEEGGECVYEVYTIEYTFEPFKIQCTARVTFSGSLLNRSWINGDTLYAVWLPEE